VIILFLVGCKLDLSSDLNVEDLHRCCALSKQNKIASTGTIKFEVGSIANCGHNREFFTSILEIAFPGFYNSVLRTGGYGNLFIASITAFFFLAWF
jgi:hypothetical protein